MDGFVIFSDFTIKQEFFSVTVSTGLAMIEEDHPDLCLYLEAADTALYRAKATGRNKVVVAEYGAQPGLLANS
jgi:diguanylate cyclase (GGDEF)-like protein